MGSDTWISVDDRLPVVPAPAFTLKRMEFKVDGRRYIGEYHCNGCFYAREMAATTPRARAEYSPDLLAGMPPATHWRSADSDTEAV